MKLNRNDLKAFLAFEKGRARRIADLMMPTFFSPEEILAAQLYAERLDNAYLRASKPRGSAADCIPPRYISATCRDMTPVDPHTGCVGIGFTTEAGEVFLKLDEQSVSHILEQVAVARRDLVGDRHD